MSKKHEMPFGIRFLETPSEQELLEINGGRHHKKKPSHHGSTGSGSTGSTGSGSTGSGSTGVGGIHSMDIMMPIGGGAAHYDT